MLSSNEARLAEEHPSAFREPLDYAQQLSSDGPIDQERFRTASEKLRHSEVKRYVSPGKIFMSVHPEDPLIVNSTDPMVIIAKECPAAPGVLVLVQINPRTSAEGYTLRDDSSYWSDPSLYGESWKSPFRPAILLSATKKRKGIIHVWLFLSQSWPLCVIVERNWR